ncbi:PREDICTED: FAS1 domain-containing protein SELMODRAFT_448915-like [Camelina sativa]|uniref:FAS1 domain-containing protein SELMODRAFT_448915-like n=1 Tax=Camelina sativa TaxID=90675 RepID=A0ABM0X4Z8_CAMSA|nr:PREDICTED: FAS1 domain-containing protein SELMODRAFT_448915-like [Camelina sativa]
MATSSHLLLIILITTVSLLTSAASPPPYLTSQDHQHADRIIEAMIGAGDFRDWAADFLSSVDDQFGIPLSATFFIPSDFDSADVSSSSTGDNANNPLRLSVAYHIVPQRLSFTDLRLLKPLSRLPTLLPGNSIVVTNNSASGYTLDGVLVSEPDLFISSSIALHGVASTLDFSRYGDLGNGDTAFADSLRPRRRSRRRRRHQHGGFGPLGGNDDNGDGDDTNQTSVSLFTAHYSSTGSFLVPLVALALF